jgi:hypothetical protein
MSPPAQLTVIVPACVWLRDTSADAVAATMNDATAAIAIAKNKGKLIDRCDLATGDHATFWRR